MMPRRAKNGDTEKPDLAAHLHADLGMEITLERAAVCIWQEVAAGSRRVAGYFRTQQAIETSPVFAGDEPKPTSTPPPAGSRRALFHQDRAADSWMRTMRCTFVTNGLPSSQLLPTNRSIWNCTTCSPDRGHAQMTLVARVALTRKRWDWQGTISLSPAWLAPQAERRRYRLQTVLAPTSANQLPN